MSIVKTLSQSDFISEFRSMSDTYNNQFSYEGLQALYDHLEEYSDSTSEPVEFDPVALCCEYTEYTDLREASETFFMYDATDEERAEYTDEKAREYFANNTFLLEFEGGIIIQDF